MRSRNNPLALFSIALAETLSTKADLMAFVHARRAGHFTVPIVTANLLAHVCVTSHGCVSATSTLLTGLHPERTHHVTFPVDDILGAVRGIAGHGLARGGSVLLLHLTSSSCYTGPRYKLGCTHPCRMP